MNSDLEASVVVLKQTSDEALGDIGTEKRYNYPLRAAFEKICKDMEKVVSDEECLWMAVYAVNETVGPEGSYPMMLVFGTMPLLIRTNPSESQLKLAENIDKAIEEVKE